jgi:hypothetical protein
VKAGALIATGGPRRYLLAAGLVLFAVSLLAPGIVFRPDARSNPKRGECAFAMQDDVVCSSFGFGAGATVCEVAKEARPGETFVDRQKIIDYCKGWDAPVAERDLGYVVLATGFLGVFVGVFAWFANPLMLLAVLLSLSRRRVVAMVLAVAAVALGLQAYALDAVPFNEASMEPDNLNYVDRLGYGFYLWMASLVILAAYCCWKPEPRAPVA